MQVGDIYIDVWNNMRTIIVIVWGFEEDNLVKMIQSTYYTIFFV